MRIKRKFDFLIGAIILLFLFTFTISYVSNRYMHTNTLYVFLVSFSFLVSAIVAIRIAINRKVIAPILAISNTSRLMACGDLEKEIQVSSQDELKELADNFNSMAASLREKTTVLEKSLRREQRVVRELTMLNEFVGYLSSELEFETILQRFIEKARDLMKAEASAIFIFQPDGMRSFLSTEPSISEGIIEALLSLRSLNPSKIIEEHELVHSNDISLPVSRGRTIRNFMALPLSSTTDIRSLVVVVNGQKGFSEEDEESLFRFAFQAFQTLALQYEVAKLATTDGLTELYNHITFQGKLSEEVLRAERYKRNLSLIMIDIDHFKKFNDTYGHQTGDNVLKTLAGIIKRCIRKIDFPARYGGEEFIVILPESDYKSAGKVAERIRTSVMEYPFLIKDGSTMAVTISAGVSSFSEDTTKKEKLIEMADSALYYAKDLGRNRVVLYCEIPGAHDT